LTDIGEFVSELGLWQRSADRRISVLEPCGWEHRL
jgi:hypothetical protein